MVTDMARFLRSLHREERGFTLIELLIVIAILAVLAAIAIPLVVNQIDKARIAADKANVAALQIAVDIYEFERDEKHPGENLDQTGETGMVNGDNGFITQLIEKGYLQKPVESPYKEGGYRLYPAAGTGMPLVESTETDSWNES